MENQVKHPEKYVVLEHLTLPDRGLRFWSHNRKDNTHGWNGELWYKEILFTDSEEDTMECARHHSQTASYSELEEYWKEKIQKDNQEREANGKINYL